MLKALRDPLMAHKCVWFMGICVSAVILMTYPGTFSPLAWGGEWTAAIGYRDRLKPERQLPLAWGDDGVAVVRAQSNGMPEPVGEEVDIFRERANERSRQARRESKTRKKEKAPETVSKFFSMTPTEPKEVLDGFGVIGRASHLGGKTFGRTDSITPLEVMPYILTDEHFFFADVRGFASNRSRLGGNAGLGYRYLREDFNALGFGVAKQPIHSFCSCIRNTMQVT